MLEPGLRPPCTPQSLANLAEKGWLANLETLWVSTAKLCPEKQKGGSLL